MKCVNCKKKFDEIKYDYLCTHCGSYNAKKITNIEEGERKSSFFKQIFTIISAMLTVVTICSFVWNLVFELGTEESAPEPPMKKQIAESIEKEEQVEALVLEYDENGFLVAEGVLLEYIGTDRYVTIPSDVKVISTGVFRGNEAIETVILNEGLSNITIPTSLERVHGDAFDVNAWYYENHPFGGFGQDGDFTVEIPDSVTQIDGELYQIMFNGENNIAVRCSEGSYAYDYALEYGYKIEIR